ncbi:hypothetical protein [Fulvivirga sp. M361]|uniref:hypothetical protein n=1 Tax=Fulvivirga sp. M361 TaxID=2594266 RepID=UPI00162402BD|nr:hypothetical protein [Fulvivirga sp. M361]
MSKVGLLREIERDALGYGKVVAPLCSYYDQVGNHPAKAIKNPTTSYKGDIF